MDQVRTIAIERINGAIDDIQIVERWIVQVRDKLGPQLHPWAMPSLANAIGSIQHAISDLKSAKHHIETPVPDEIDEGPAYPMIDASVDPVAEMANPHSDIPTI